MAPAVSPPEALIDDRQPLLAEPAHCLVTTREIVLTGRVPLDEFVPHRRQPACAKALEGPLDMVLLQFLDRQVHQATRPDSPGQIGQHARARSGRSARPGHSDLAIGGRCTAVPYPHHIASHIPLCSQPSFRQPRNIRRTVPCDTPCLRPSMPRRTVSMSPWPADALPGRFEGRVRTWGHVPGADADRDDAHIGGHQVPECGRRRNPLRRPRRPDLQFGLLASGRSILREDHGNHE